MRTYYEFVELLELAERYEATITRDGTGVTISLTTSEGFPIEQGAYRNIREALEGIPALLQELNRYGDNANHN